MLNFVEKLFISAFLSVLKDSKMNLMHTTGSLPMYYMTLEKSYKVEIEMIDELVKIKSSFVKLTNDLFLKFMEDIHKTYPEYTKFCFAGGLFANVKLNQKINELDWVNEIYIYPPMGDEGLSLGACIMKSVELGEWTKPKKFKNLYLIYRNVFKKNLFFSVISIFVYSFFIYFDACIQK